jgi:Domain of unknown function (DUF4157)
VRTFALQRCAACGHGHDGGECPACRARRLGNTASLVHETLNRPGRPLESGVRGDLERSLGHDFSAVRVHTDEPAAASAAAVSAQAYTVGSNVVFGANRYRPASTEGRRLLAHELTHVRQQAGAAPGGPLRIVDDPAAEAEANRAAAAPVSPVQQAVQRLTDEESEAEVEAEVEPATEPEPGTEAPPVIEEDEGGETPEEVPVQAPPAEAAPAQQAPPAVACPTLTLADFTVGVPPGGFEALTVFSIPFRNGAFQAVFNTRRSIVRAKYPGAGARATNGCNAVVRRCQRAFRNVPRGATRTFDIGPSPNCPATIVTPAQATSRAECETVIGAQCDADAPNEADRLLNHEQRHLDIACKIADKANTALAAGSALAAVRRAVARQRTAVTRRYDSRAETDHGCDAAGQAAWDADIDAGLPGVTIP